jgi:hypothetical protein
MDPESFIYRCRLHLFRFLLASVIIFSSFGGLEQENGNIYTCVDKVRPLWHTDIPHLPKKVSFVNPDEESGYFFYVRRTQALFNNAILQAADQYHVDPALIKAIIMVESSYNPRATSSKGAMGLMQLMPATARAMGVDDSFNPENNINGGVRYFKQLLSQFDNDVRLALAAYNAGSRKVKEYKDIPPFKTTRLYVKKVLTYYSYYKKVMTATKVNNV